MKTDHLDLWHMHGVSYKRDIDQIFGPGGAYEAFAEAKKAGKVRFIGYSNCRDPLNHVEMLKHADQFDVSVMPLHIADSSFSDEPVMSFEKTALPCGGRARCRHRRPSRSSAMLSCCERSPQPTACASS